MDKEFAPHQSNIPMLVIILISFMVASTINIYPLNTSTALMRPMMMIMVLIFWLIFQPKYVGVMTAFAIGLIADLLLDTRLGQQAFAAVVVALLIKVSSIYLKQLTLWSAWLLACVSLLVFQIVLWILQYIGQSIFVASSVWSMLISMLTWGFVYLLLHRFVR